MYRRACLIGVAALTGFAAQASAQSAGMNMPMVMPMSQQPAQFEPTREAYTEDHQYLIKLVALPKPIPFGTAFDLRFAVMDGKQPTRQLSNVQLELFAGMRHGTEHSFIHSMETPPQVTEKDGAFAVSDMNFDMMGPWTVGVTVRKEKEESTAYFQLPCCGK
jgi:hypothetical protein